MVSGVGRGMGVLEGGGDRRRKGAVFGVNLELPIVTPTLLRSCARATRSSQITLGGLVSLRCCVSSVTKTN